MCGEKMLAFDWNNRPGPLLKYNKEDAKADWGEGYIFGTGYERAFVGNREMVVEHPKGA